MDLKSSVFQNGGYIPDRYTCDGKNYSLPLRWDNLPKGTKSLALVVDDPDAPVDIWVHWVVYNLPADIEGIEENISSKKLNTLGAEQGKNDFGQIGYGGPCPPPGSAHKYSFKLYALDENITAEDGLTKSELMKIIRGHIMAETKISAFYQRQKNRKGEDNGKN
ncbi:MAG: YbhB/YbcL family Raf kinase inhibitor-like protein [Candidatus Omnitrophica bacterium]|nr:YbhB/YbcL family Raf kinase inhibitor-like protein [Candidatus Omnitrophota bacterium]